MADSEHSIPGPVPALVQELIAQLRASAEKLQGLAVLEQVLGPIADWSRTWAKLEARLLNLGRNPEDTH